MMIISLYYLLMSVIAKLNYNTDLERNQRAELARR